MTGQQAGKKTYISAVPKDTAMSVCEVRTAFTAKFVVAAPQRARGWWVHLILRDWIADLTCSDFDSAVGGVFLVFQFARQYHQRHAKPDFHSSRVKARL